MSGTNGDGDTHGGRDTGAEGGIKPLAAGDPARIGPYLLLGRLGAGGMGRVFLARSDSGRTVAVKVVHEEHVSDEHFRARFRREIEAARKVGERYTAPVLDAGPGDEPPWVATGYVPGLSLDQVVRLYGPLPPASLHALADGLLKALKDIHGAGIVHRDLKPSNVMLTVDGTKVIDFGIARALETSVESMLTSTGMAIGSPGFMSPEQVRGERAGVKSDVFTLGCVLTFAATGQLPFGSSASNQHAVMFQIVEGEPDLTRIEDTALRAFVARCLTKDIDQRPGVEELLADPGRPRPDAGPGAWLPAGVVAHLAQQSARLLDAEAAPLREEPVDRATVGLRPKDGPPEAGRADDGITKRRRRNEREPRRRRRLIVLPIVAVVTVGGGSTVLLLQPFDADGGADGARAKSPGISASATPGGSNSPGGPSGSPSKAANGKAKDGDGDGDAGKGQNGEGGSDGPNARESGGTSSGDKGASDSGDAGSTGSSGGDSAGSDDPPPPSGSRPPAMKSYRADYTNSCVGACDMPIKVSWPAVPRATGYDVKYTNSGSNYTEKNVDTTYSTAGTSYTIKGPYSGDEVCVTVRATNKYGASAWAETLCETVPY